MKKDKRTITDVKRLLQNIVSEDDPLFSELKTDPRKGIQQALSQWRKEKVKEQILVQHQIKMMQEEQQLKVKGYRVIAGIDEVGRGPLAGPVVAAAVILPEDMPPLPINDSKKLSAKTREELYEYIMQKAEVGIGLVDNTVIDEVNIYEATKIAMKKALISLSCSPDALLIDAMHLSLPVHQKSLIGGDAKSYSIAAASIVAKVHRDRLMKEYAKEYPYYHFDSNVGYGTKAHLEGLEKYGITPLHRKTFEPIKSMVQKLS